MNNLQIILNELGYSLRKHNLGYELRHIDSVALFIARKVKQLQVAQ